MITAVIVIILECFKLSLQIDRVPEQRLIKKLTANGPDQAFDEWVRDWGIGDGSDWFNLKNTEVRLPSVILEKWIVIRT